MGRLGGLAAAMGSGKLGIDICQIGGFTSAS